MGSAIERFHAAVGVDEDDPVHGRIDNGATA